MNSKTYKWSCAAWEALLVATDALGHTIGHRSGDVERMRGWPGIRPHGRGVASPPDNCTRAWVIQGTCLACGLSVATDRPTPTTRCKGLGGDR